MLPASCIVGGCSGQGDRGAVRLLLCEESIPAALAQGRLFVLCLRPALCAESSWARRRSGEPLEIQLQSLHGNISIWAVLTQGSNLRLSKSQWLSGEMGRRLGERDVLLSPAGTIVPLTACSGTRVRGGLSHLLSEALRFFQTALEPRMVTAL